MKNKVITVKDAKKNLSTLESKKDILNLDSKRSSSITVAREMEAMRSLLKDKQDDDVLISIVSRSFLDMKKVCKL